MAPIEGMTPQDTEMVFIAACDTTYKVLDAAADEILAEIANTPTHRLHHLENLIALVEDLKTLGRAQEIVQELMDPREEEDNTTG